MVCYGERTMFYEYIIRDGVKYLEDNRDVSGDELKCYLLAYELLKRHEIFNIINLEGLKELISKRISDVICRDVSKYGVEYVPIPSDLFIGIYLEFITSEIEHLVQAEKEVLEKLQKEDGGFDIWWKWYTPYSEFEQARKYWRPRITIEKLLFYGAN